jgi:hypothetical protein
MSEVYEMEQSFSSLVIREIPNNAFIMMGPRVGRREQSYLLGDLTEATRPLKTFVLGASAVEAILPSFSRKWAATLSQTAASLMSIALLLRAALKLDMRAR